MEAADPAEEAETLIAAIEIRVDTRIQIVVDTPIPTPIAPVIPAGTMENRHIPALRHIAAVTCVILAEVNRGRNQVQNLHFLL